jgi:GAF domain-containing protein
VATTVARLGAELAASGSRDRFHAAVHTAVATVATPDGSIYLGLHGRHLRLEHAVGVDRRDGATIAAFDDADGPVRRCLADRAALFYSGRSQLIDDHPSVAGTLAADEFRARAFIPIMVDNRPLGAIVCQWFGERTFNEHVSEGLAEIGRIAGLALDRMIAHETAVLIAEIEAQLPASRSSDAIAQVVAQLLRPEIGAHTVHLGLLDGDLLHKISASGLTLRASRDFTSIELAQPQNDETRARAGSTLFLTDEDDWGPYPLLRRARDATGCPAILCEPVRQGGDVIALLTCGFLDARDCGPIERERVTRIAEILGRSIARAALVVHERTVTERLQRTVLPAAMPTVEGYEIAASYVAASVDDGLDVGGDWFDCFELRDHTIALSIGDTARRGIEAAGATGQIRSACRALADVSDGPADLIGRLDRLTASLAPTFGTSMFFGNLDPNTGLVRFCRAGHPEPVVVDGHGVFAQPDGKDSQVLGPSPGSTRSQGAFTLGPGSTLLLFTDGLIARHDETIEVGHQRLRRSVAMHRDLPLDDFVAAITNDVVAPHHADDRCVFALRRTGRSTPGVLGQVAGTSLIA